MALWRLQQWANSPPTPQTAWNYMKHLLQQACIWNWLKTDCNIFPFDSLNGPIPVKTCKAGADPSSPAQPLLSASNEIQHPANQLQAWPCSCKFHTLVFATSHRAATHNTEPKPPSLLCSFMPLILGGFHGCSHTQPQNEVAGLSGFLPYPKNGSLQVSLMDVEIHSHCRSLVSVVTASECATASEAGKVSAAQKETVSQNIWLFGFIPNQSEVAQRGSISKFRGSPSPRQASWLGALASETPGFLQPPPWAAATRPLPECCIWEA